jgi:hypothetical protein
MATVIVVREFEEDQPEHRNGVFAGLEVRVGAQVVGCAPKIGFELFELLAGHGFFIGRLLTPPF